LSSRIWIWDNERTCMWERVVRCCFWLLRYIWKSQYCTSLAVLAAFKKVFQRTTRRPLKLQTDDSTEFWYRGSQKFLKENNITCFTVKADKKAAVAERVIRTLRENIFIRYYKKFPPMCFHSLSLILHFYILIIGTSGLQCSKPLNYRFSNTFLLPGKINLGLLLVSRGMTCCAHYSQSSTAEQDAVLRRLLPNDRKWSKRHRQLHGGGEGIREKSPKTAALHRWGTRDLYLLPVSSRCQ
jgi:hypothetical protein